VPKWESSANTNSIGKICLGPNLNGRSYQDLVAFAPASEWEAFSCASGNQKETGLDAL
jgi:hypothetical protein